MACGHGGYGSAHCPAPGGDGVSAGVRRVLVLAATAATVTATAIATAFLTIATIGAAIATRGQG